jgi:hypothetical protein
MDDRWLSSRSSDCSHVGRGAGGIAGLGTGGARLGARMGPRRRGEPLWLPGVCEREPDLRSRRARVAAPERASASRCSIQPCRASAAPRTACGRLPCRGPIGTRTSRCASGGQSAPGSGVACRRRASARHRRALLSAAPPVRHDDGGSRRADYSPLPMIGKRPAWIPTSAGAHLPSMPGSRRSRWTFKIS